MLPLPRPVRLNILRQVVIDALLRRHRDIAAKQLKHPILPFGYEQVAADGLLRMALLLQPEGALLLDDVLARLPKLADELLPELLILIAGCAISSSFSLSLKSLHPARISWFSMMPMPMKRSMVSSFAVCTSSCVTSPRDCARSSADWSENDTTDSG